MQTQFHFRKVAILGAGVMGAQIAAHFVNANIPVLLFDLAAKNGDPDSTVKKSIESLKKLEPSPLSIIDKANYIDAANYDQHLPLLKDCDLIIEAISERIDWKISLYEKIAPYIKENAVLASNTSGLSIETLAQKLPQNLRPNFCGIHFFNPPRYMHLVELIPNKKTNSSLLDELETFLTTTLGKGVLRVKDTPNFLANRIGVFSILAILHHAEKFNLPLDVVDALTGPLIGRPKSATFRTIDVVGLDTFAHVVKTMHDSLSDDPWHPYFKIPVWMQTLIDQGMLGQKTQGGIYRKVSGKINVLDLAEKDYRLAKTEVDPSISEVFKIKVSTDRVSALRNHTSPQAQFIWAINRDLYHYCAYHLAEIADNARDLDFATRWGFGWQTGPFETWQMIGWKQIAGWIAEDIHAKKTMADVSLPDWVTKSGRTKVHREDGSYSPAEQSYKKRSDLPVYKRQLFPDKVIGEKFSNGTTVFENDAVRFWHMNDGIGILSFNSKVHAIGNDVLDGTLKAIDEAEKKFMGMVIWQPESPFSAGANLAEVVKHIQEKNYAALEKLLEKFQLATKRLKYSNIPTVAALQNLALGGGCEFVMHCHKTVAALESYIGLVEIGVGLIPAGGGCKELAIRAMQDAKGGDVFPFVQKYFQRVAMANVAKSAEHAKELGYLKPSDTIVMNPFELLYVAKSEARNLFEANYRPPLEMRNISVAGKTGIATLKMMLVNMKEGGFISEYDYEIGSHLAYAMCGGEIEVGSLVDENWLLRLEREAFMALLKNQKTHARIDHMLKTNKPLRN